MNETISTHCPSLQELVTTLEVEARFQVTKLEKIRRGKVVAWNSQRVTINESLEYYVSSKD